MIIKDWWTVEFIDSLIAIDRALLQGDTEFVDVASVRAQIDDFLDVRNRLGA